MGREEVDLVSRRGRDLSRRVAGVTTPVFTSAAYDIRSGISGLDAAGVADFTELAALTAAATKADLGQYLLFVPQGVAYSATGKPMPAVDVHPEDTRRWRVTLADREAYGSVAVHWHDAETGERKTEIAGSGDPRQTLRRTYASAPEAAEAARSKLAQLARGTARLSVDLSPGNPVVAAEAELRLEGFRDGVDGSWTCRRVAHELARGGYSTAVEAELKAA